MYFVRSCRAAFPVLLYAAVLHAGKTLPGFEVASIRIHTAAETETNTTVFPGGRLAAFNLSVRKMLRNAFNVEDYQISQAPRWADTLNYDIEAKMPPGIGITREDIPQLLLSLLERRFSNTTSRSGIVTLKARTIPMSDLAYSLRRQLGRPVADKTQVAGNSILI